jgi:type IV secretion system protein VirB10
MNVNDPLPENERDINEAGIVSVNSRGAAGGNVLGKVFFVSGVFGLLLVAGFYGYNRYRESQAATASAAKQTSKNESKPAAAGIARDFDKEQAAADAAAAPPPPGQTASTSKQKCSDGTAGIEAKGPDGHVMATATGAAMRVCSDGQIIVPDIGAAPIALASNQQSGQPKPSRYAGDAIISSSTATGGNSGSGTISGVPTDPNAQMSYVNGVVQQLRSGPAGGNPAAGIMSASAQPTSAAGGPGQLGSQLTPSNTPLVQAGMLGDRNMILPKGRSIDCGLSVRLVSDLPGLASCIVSQNVYSDNGKVLLIERGSEAVGEYGSSMTQGQHRLFVLWSRIKMPNGVVMNLNSPGSDELGTSGLPGLVNNHWWERLGAAALLTIVQDFVAYKTAQTGNGSTASLAVMQNTGQTTNDMANTILQSTINIKPTLYKNQGDRSAIYVARDLDFSTVYALHPR